MALLDNFIFLVIDVNHPYPIAAITAIAAKPTPIPKTDTEVPIIGILRTVEPITLKVEDLPANLETTLPILTNGDFTLPFKFKLQVLLLAIMLSNLTIPARPEDARIDNLKFLAIALETPTLFLLVQIFDKSLDIVILKILVPLAAVFTLLSILEVPPILFNILAKP